VAKFQKIFGVPYSSSTQGMIMPNLTAGDQSSAIISPQGNYGPPIQSKPPTPAPVIMPPTPVGPPIIAIPGGHRRRPKPPEGGRGGPPPWAHGRGWGRGGYDRDHRRRHSYGQRPGPMPPGPAPIGPPQSEGPPLPVGPPVVVPAPMPVVPAPTGKPCPTWGWAVSTNPDGSETVHQCTPGQPMAAGLHGLYGSGLSGLDGITDTLESTLGPNWMLYLGLGIGAWFLLKKMR
jgi:hypothetical protein